MLLAVFKILPNYAKIMPEFSNYAPDFRHYAHKMTYRSEVYDLSDYVLLVPVDSVHRDAQ